MVVVSFGLAILTLHLIENPARFAPSLKVSAERSLAVGAVLDGCRGRRLPGVVDGAAGARWATEPPRRRSCPWPRPRRLRRQRRLPPMSVQDQVLAAVAKSAEPAPVPANLSPTLGAIAKPEVFVNGCVLSWRDVAQPDCVSGDAGAPTTVALVGRFACRDVAACAGTGCAGTALAVGDDEQGALPADGSADQQPVPRPQVHGMRAMAG